ncbi:hypothetical protein [Pseudomonas sp. nanlin1]|uniref:hypothetical protein n=1 Tax=Pseudomonas sp. nanlin1 TaxID=3040605 RepID=UPI00388FD3B7
MLRSRLWAVPLLAGALLLPLNDAASEARAMADWSGSSSNLLFGLPPHPAAMVVLYLYLGWHDYPKSGF